MISTGSRTFSPARSGLVCDFTRSSYPGPGIPPRRRPPLPHQSGTDDADEPSRRPRLGLARPPPHREPRAATPSLPSTPQRVLELIPRGAGSSRINALPSCRENRYRHHRADRRDEQLSPSARVNILSLKGEVVQCVVSGTILLAFFGTYLGLALSKHDPSQPFTVTMIIGILVFTIFFLHALFRLHMFRQRISFSHALNASRQPKRPRFRYSLRSHALRRQLNRPRNPDVLPNDDSVYTPRTAVRVHLAQDEEAALSEKTDGSDEENLHERGRRPCPLAPPPPAYGLWRCSVRADPTLLFWQPGRRDNLHLPINPLAATSMRRPPSYATEAGFSLDGDHASRMGHGRESALGEDFDARGRIEDSI